MRTGSLPLRGIQVPDPYSAFSDTTLYGDRCLLKSGKGRNAASPLNFCWCVCVCSSRWGDSAQDFFGGVCWSRAVIV